MRQKIKGTAVIFSLYLLSGCGGYTGELANGLDLFPTRHPEVFSLPDGVTAENVSLDDKNETV